MILTRSWFSQQGSASSPPARSLSSKLSHGNNRQWQRHPQSKRLLSVSQAALKEPLAAAALGTFAEREVPDWLQPFALVPEPQTEALRLLRPLRKLMSYNTENFYQTSKNANIKSPEAIQALADVINQESPDVIALQEVGDKGLLTNFNNKYLNGLYPNVVSKPVWVRSQHQLAFLTKGDIRVVDTKSHWKDFCKLSQGAAVRDLLETTFETDTGYRFTVFNAHLKSMRGNEQKTAPVRMKEAAAAAAILRKRLQTEPEAHVFLTGDLNTHYESEAGRPVIETLQRLGAEDGELQLSEVTLKNHQHIPTNRSEGFPDAKLDYTFTSPALTPLVRQAYVAGRFDEAPWQVASDHLPLITLFEEGQPQTQPEPDVLKTPPRVERPLQSENRGQKRKLELIA